MISWGVRLPRPEGDCRVRPAADLHAHDDERGGVGGFLTVEYVAVIGFSLVLFTVLANLIVFEYGRGVVRAAVDEAARAGSRTTAGAAECERRGESAIEELMGGAMGDGLSFTCRDTGSTVVARASGTFDGWLPLVPSIQVAATGVARREAVP